MTYLWFTYVNEEDVKLFISYRKTTEISNIYVSMIVCVKQLMEREEFPRARHRRRPDGHERGRGRGRELGRGLNNSCAHRRRPAGSAWLVLVLGLGLGLGLELGRMWPQGQ